MNANAPSEILKRWRALEDVDEERKLFSEYTRVREVYLSALQLHAKNKMSAVDLSSALHAEKSAFDAYVSHRTSSTYRVQSN